eukprot:734362-Pelagomonas_calceolata.AAC.2
MGCGWHGWCTVCVSSKRVFKTGVHILIKMSGVHNLIMVSGIHILIKMSGVHILIVTSGKCVQCLNQFDSACLRGKVDCWCCDAQPVA